MKITSLFIGKLLIFILIIYTLLGVGLSFGESSIFKSDWYSIEIAEVSPQTQINNSNSSVVYLGCYLDIKHTNIGTPFPFYITNGSSNCYHIYFSFYGLILDAIILFFLAKLIFFRKKRTKKD